MIELDLISLADCFTPKQLVNEIRRQHPDLKPPIPIRDIAKAVGIQTIDPMATEEVEGMLVADAAKESGVIFYKESSPLGRQRFTIGHELGHFLLLHHGYEQSCSTRDIKVESKPSSVRESESEANEFSQLLLMPDDLILQEIVNKPINLELLKIVENTFQMSFEAIANKCASLSNVPYALIYSLNGVVRYCWRDWEKFPYWIPFKGGDSMPLFSQASTLKQSEETISDSRAVNYSDWIEVKRHKAPPRFLVEQTYTQRKGFQVTMLRYEE